MMIETPRALMISPEFPYPLTSGGRQRSFHILKALSEAYQLDLLSFSEQPRPEGQEAVERLGAQVRVISLPPHPKTPTAFLRRNLSRAIRGINPLVDRFSDPPVRQSVRDWLRHHRYDLILMEHTWIAPYITEVKASQHRAALTVLDAHNVESELWKQYYHQPARWWHKPALFRYWRSAREVETRYLNQFDLVLAVSEADARRIAQLSPDATLALIPNGIDLPQTGADPEWGGRPPVIGFIGSLEYPPNQLGLEWFLTEVWPQIKERVLEAQLLIIGRAEAPKLTRLCQADERIRLAGTVTHLAPHLNRIAVLIVPLWHGGGTRIKILEAWAHGIAVVSTSQGAEGLDASHMEELWIADTPADFATAVVYLLSDPMTRQRLCRAARQHVQKYAWPVIERQLLAVLDHHLSTTLAGL